MRVLNDTLRQIELATRLDGAAAYLLPLHRGIGKLYADAHKAHLANGNIRPSQIQKLSECELCSRVESSMGHGPLCIDNDAWKSLGDLHDFGVICPSVDLLLFAEDAGLEQLVMVEAKLGGATRRRGDAPQRPTQTELREKYDCSVRRICGRIPIGPTLILIVSSNTLSKMRRKVWRWNASDSSHPISCTCCADFLRQFGAQLADASRINVCTEGSRQ